MTVFRWTAIMVCVATAVGCDDSPQDIDAELQMTSVASVVERLEDTGVTVEVVGPVEQSFYPTDATQLRVDGEEMLVFEYESESEAQTNSASRPLALWASPPHFYLSGRFMALYVGTSEDVLDALEDVFGEELDP